MKMMALSLGIAVAALISLASCQGGVASSQNNTAESIANRGFEVSIDRAALNFPEGIKFYLEGVAPSPVSDITLEYKINERTVGQEITSVNVQKTGGPKVVAFWTLDLKKQGALPPGAVLRWKWKIAGVSGNRYETTEKSVEYSDTRFTWNKTPVAMADLHWNSQDEKSIRSLTAGLELQMARIKLKASIPEIRKPKIFVYSTRQEMLSAVPTLPAWSAAAAMPRFNIILVYYSPGDLDEAKRTIVHEFTHLLVGELTFGPYESIPRWLNEGLAQFAEGPIKESEMKDFKSLIRFGQTISVQSLGGGFPSSASGSAMAYIEGRTLVMYLLETGGWSKMESLLKTFKEGSTCDSALSKVYGFDTAGLEDKWMDYVLQWYLPVTGERPPAP
jgi:hypothetical protein